MWTWFQYFISETVVTYITQFWEKSGKGSCILVKNINGGWNIIMTSYFLPIIFCFSQQKIHICEIHNRKFITFEYLFAETALLLQLYNHVLVRNINLMIYIHFWSECDTNVVTAWILQKLFPIAYLLQKHNHMFVLGMCMVVCNVYL